jgi:hypothetical protein
MRDEGPYFIMSGSYILMCFNASSGHSEMLDLAVRMHIFTADWDLSMVILSLLNNVV